jgi:hypothetical protein
VSSISSLQNVVQIYNYFPKTKKAPVTLKQKKRPSAICVAGSAKKWDDAHDQREHRPEPN